MLMQRIVMVSRPIEETWETLPMDEQIEWANFFSDYLKKVVGIEVDSGVGGALAQLWALSHEYYRVYGPLWKEKAGVEVVLNPPSEKLVDETSGIEVDSQKFNDWAQGRQVGWKEARDKVSTINYEAEDPEVFRRNVLAAFGLLPKRE
jgi:hypothetical protein